MKINLADRLEVTVLHSKIHTSTLLAGDSGIDYLNCSGQFPLRLDYGRSPHAYVNQRLQMQLELLMMSGVPLETC